MTTIATLFSGGEGVGVGARMAGLAHLWGIEYDAAIADVARANGFHTITADVTQVNWSTLPAPDILHASPPCPNFSVAKTNRGETAQDRAVAQAVCDAITTLLPRVFTLENVRGYAGSESLKRIGETLHNLDYAVETFIVNATDYGVPQTRERLFLVARRGGWMRAPLVLPRKTRWIGWYEAIADLLDTLPPSQFAPWQLARLPEELRAMLGDTSTTPITDEERAEAAMTAEEREEWGDRTWRESVLMTGIKHMARNITLLDCESPASTIDTTFRPSHVPHAFIVSNQATEYSDGIVNDATPMLSVTPQMAGRARAFLVDSANTSRDATRLDADDPAMTVQAWHGRRPSHAPTAAVHGRVVAMTPRALARFQSFPDDYILPDKKSLACRVLGNAVPPKLYAALIGAILEQI